MAEVPPAAPTYSVEGVGGQGWPKTRVCPRFPYMDGCLSYRSATVMMNNETTTTMNNTATVIMNNETTTMMNNNKMTTR